MSWRYTTLPSRPERPRADYYYDYWGDLMHLPRLAAIEDDTPRDTGLLDSRGNPLYRVRERGKLGF